MRNADDGSRVFLRSYFKVTAQEAVARVSAVRTQSDQKQITFPNLWLFEQRVHEYLRIRIETMACFLSENMDLKPKSTGGRKVFSPHCDHSFKDDNQSEQSM